MGGGPAGTLVATVLARSGVDVIQAVGASPNVRPREILGPAARRLLAKEGMAEWEEQAVPCRGVLSAWASAEPEFHDYELTGCTAGLAVSRGSLHAALAGQAIQSGARVLEPAMVKPRQDLARAGAPIEISTGAESTWVVPRTVVDATGRQNQANAAVTRTHLDRLMAFWTPFERERHQDCLLLESSSAGWWYVPPSAGRHTDLVCLTDLDLVPTETAERQEWFAAQFATCTLLPGIAAANPSFASLHGTDARSSTLSSVTHDRWVAVGDTALALDPLSGKGAYLALSGANAFCSALRAGDGSTAAYESWWRRTSDQELAARAAVYSDGYKRFPGAPFWQRRTAMK